MAMMLQPCKHWYGAAAAAAAAAATAAATVLGSCVAVQCCSCVGWAQDAVGQVQRVCRVPRLVSHHFPFIVTRQSRLLTLRDWGEGVRRVADCVWRAPPLTRGWGPSLLLQPQARNDYALQTAVTLSRLR